MRINFYGGAGSGKSTTAHWLFSELKRLGYSVEFAREYIKKYTYLTDDPRTVDQIEVFENQLLEESIPLEGGIKNIVSECPIHLSYIYSKLFRPPEIATQIKAACDEFDEKYPSVDIYLKRGDKPYIAEGRWGTLEGAKKVDKEIEDYLANGVNPVMIAGWTQRESILTFVLAHADQ